MNPTEESFSRREVIAGGAAVVLAAATLAGDAAAEPASPAGYDVVIVGGGPAGLSAALILGRSRRRVLVVDAGKPRNAPSPAVHAFLTRDGAKPADLLALGREQLKPYDGVKVVTDEAIDAARDGARFVVTLQSGKRVLSARLLFATGIGDELPEVEGLRERWGKSVFHCPYCHGWEVRDAPLAVYNTGETAAEQSLMLTGWTRDIVLCTDGPAPLSAEDRARLAANKITVREEKVARLVGPGQTLEAVEFAGGERLARRGLFVRTEPAWRTDLPVKLGCALAESGAVRVDDKNETTVPGVFAAGDAAGKPMQVIGIAADGAKAAYAINRELIWERLAG